MTRYHATADGDVPFTSEEEAEWDAREVANAAAKLPNMKAAFIVKIDSDVDAIYAATLGQRTTEYTLAESDAQAYKDAGYTGTVPDSVQAWATAKSSTATWAADDILASATAWRTAQASIRAARLLRKEQTRTAADEAGVATVQAQWAGFVVHIRGQLGI